LAYVLVVAVPDFNDGFGVKGFEGGGERGVGVDDEGGGVVEGFEIAGEADEGPVGLGDGGELDGLA